MYLSLFLMLGVAGSSEPMASAEVCGGCHRAIHQAWKSSSHAQAMESRLFQDVLEMAETDFGPQARKVCLGCHSPLAVQSGDLGLSRKVSWEGVTCEYCHSIRSVSTAGPNPKASVTVTGVKSGPLKDAVSNGHGTEYSEVHTSALVCAPCHEYKNAGGFPVLTTFSEWQNSKYRAEGKVCQSCHMSRVAGDVVDPHVKRSSIAKINLHQMPGSHSLEQLTSAFKAQVNAVHDGGQLKVAIDVSNQTAGHYLPTGSPLRRIVLELRVDGNNGEHYREERVFARKVADQQGTPIEREHVAFMKAAKVLSDTRLAPGEKRAQTFSFPLPAGSGAQVRASFWYYYSPMARTESQKRILFLTLGKMVPK